MLLRIIIKVYILFYRFASAFVKKNSKIYPKSGRKISATSSNVSVASNRHLCRHEKHSSCLKINHSDYAPASQDYKSNDNSKSSHKDSKKESVGNLTIQTSGTTLHEKVLIVSNSNEIPERSGK